MPSPKNLCDYRKASPLTQIDIAFLLNLADCTTVSRFEQGLRKPGQDARWIYHILFAAPLPHLLEGHAIGIQNVLKERINNLLWELNNKPQSQNIRKRIAFLESVISRLSAQTG
ncbi:MAG: hypothetical protein JST76_11455 [Bacteroidetes bacterium]|nr:hypothetical protein [Bacteroidota bacterium]